MNETCQHIYERPKDGEPFECIRCRQLMPTKARSQQISERRTYKVIIEFTVQLDDETTKRVERLMSEHLGMMYARMEREDDIRIVLQNKLEVKEQF